MLEGGSIGSQTRIAMDLREVCSEQRLNRRAFVESFHRVQVGCGTPRLEVYTVGRWILVCFPRWWGSFFRVVVPDGVGEACSMLELSDRRIGGPSKELSGPGRLVIVACLVW